MVRDKLTPKQRVERIEAEAVGRDLSSWERHEFLPSVRKWRASTLPPNMERILTNIEDRLFSGDTEEDE